MGERVQADGLRIDREERTAACGDRVLLLSDQEFAVLLALAEARGRVVPRQVLARRAGVRERSERRCDALLVGVRRALGDAAVHNVRNRGWMLTVWSTVV